MAFFDQSSIRIRSEWGEEAIRQLGPHSDAIVVVDVLSFCTSVEIAASRGAEVLPYEFDREKALSSAAEHGAMLAGARTDEGPSLSPRSLMSIQRGARLVLPSPNGATLSRLADSWGVPVVAGCLRNAAAVADYVTQLGGTVLVVPAGERWPDGSLRPCVEDAIGAGAIISGLGGSMSPEAESLLAVYERFKDRLLQALTDCVSGRELIERGFEADVELASELNASRTVPRLEQGAFRTAL